MKPEMIEFGRRLRLRKIEMLQDRIKELRTLIGATPFPCELLVEESEDKCERGLQQLFSAKQLLGEALSAIEATTPEQYATLFDPDPSDETLRDWLECV